MLELLLEYIDYPRESLCKPWYACDYYDSWPKCLGPTLPRLETNGELDLRWVFDCRL